MRNLMIWALSCALGLSSATSAAEYVFSARIDQANGFYPVGTVVTGSFGYDDGIAPFQVLPVDSGSVGIYADPSIFLQASVGGVSYAANAFAAVFDNVGSDGDALALTGFGPDFTLQLALFDPTSAVFTGVALPTGALPALAQGPFPDPGDDDDLTVPFASFGFSDATTGRFFDATVLSISAVPEPATWTMLIVGIGLVGAEMRRKRTIPGRLAER